MTFHNFDNLPCSENLWLSDIYSPSLKVEEMGPLDLQPLLPGEVNASHSSRCPKRQTL